MGPAGRGAPSIGTAVAASAAAVAAALVAWVLVGAGSSGSDPDTLRALGEEGGSVSAGPSGSPDPAGSAPASSWSGPPVAVQDAALPLAGSARPVEVPVQLTIEALDARMPLQPTGLDDRGFMALPESPAMAGWYRFGPAPGSGAGAVVLAAHVDSRRLGRGPLARLERLGEGDVVEVVTSTGRRDDRQPDGATRRHRYRVVSVDRLDKSQVDLDDLFSRTGPARLHLVTCGGAFDASARRYEDNVIAVAVEVP